MDWEARIQAYLNANKGSLRFATIDQIVEQVKLYVLGNRAVMSDADVRKAVARWAIFNPVWLLPEPPGGAPSTAPAPRPLGRDQASGLVDDVKKVVGRVADGVTLVQGSGSLNLKVTGATAKLQTAAGAAALTIGWTGTLGLKAESGPFHFSGELSKDKWELAVTFPDDDAVPNLSTLPKVFAEGEKAVRTIAAATATFSDISDAKRIGALVKPHVAALEEAVGAVSGIPTPQKKSGKSFGFKLGSPDPLPGEQGVPRGVQGSLTFTYWF
ncbi:hypothetical protein OPKNFCMD_1362 [Methylobacterium crusticola]|uniref:DUF4403 family protein n=1 Tax=Methylobacterium crusticola TaxID=1697972 RepID=A0ABQ4QUM2_9HYPH|nr:hypothetical protein [Methylobacterium crusticola]GJD48639.1 hypothetical protein OPKNFCMD_1362 [Methylobacterium crusticola]